MTGRQPVHWAAIDAAIEERAEAAFAFLDRLVAAPSTVGAERAAQAVVAAELAGLGFAVSEPPVPDRAAAAAPGGVAECSYAGALAVAALRAAMPEALRGELSFLSVIEEECTGNGTFAACNAGVLGDAVIVLEPTDLDLLLGGVGVLWVEIEIAGVAAHAESADRAQNPVHSLPAILTALAAFEDEINAVPDPAFGHIARPYKVSVGTVAAGDRPPSVPGRGLLRVRVGFPRAFRPDEAFRRVSAAVAAAGAADPWLAASPPAIRPVGLRAEGHLPPADHWLADAMAAAHLAASGAPPRRAPLGATTDARFYLNQFAVPALAYGPRARNIHANDEAVELASIVTGAKALARFIAEFFAAGAGPGAAGAGPGAAGAGPGAAGAGPGTAGDGAQAAGAGSGMADAGSGAA